MLTSKYIGGSNVKTHVQIHANSIGHFCVHTHIHIHCCIHIQINVHIQYLKVATKTYIYIYISIHILQAILALTSEFMLI